MTRHDDLDRTLADWFEADALAPAPSGGLDRVANASSRRRPRPAWLAGPRSRWVRVVSGVGSDSDVRTIPRLGRRWSTVLIVLLAIAAILGGVLLVGARLIQPSPLPTGRLGHLAYGLDGSIYVADWDGGNPVRIGDGVPALDTGGNECGTFRGEGRMWSPDGRHLAYRGDRCPTGESMVYVSDPEGHIVASFPGTGWLVSWSPDATRIATWVDEFKTIGIYGLDGERQALLTVPPGCALPGDFDPVWSPDGTSVIVWPCKIPLDGSTPAPLPTSDPRGHEQWAYSPEGTRVAWVDSGSLMVAAADGSQERVLVPTGVTMGGLIPKWAPTGDRIAYDAGPTLLAPDEIRVVDVATGTVGRVASVGGDGPSHVLSVSPEGDRILFWQGDATGVPSLWSVRVDGKDTQLVAPGTDWGDWQKQPVQTPRVDRVPPSSPPTAEPTPTSAASQPLATLPPFIRSDQGFLLDEQSGKAVTGQLDPGVYTYTNVDGNGFNVRFTVPVGWTWNGRYLSKGGIGPPDGAGVLFFGGSVQVYADPCHWAASQSPITRPAGLDIATFMADLAAQPMRSASTPIDRPAGGLHVVVAPGSTNPPALADATGPQPWAGMSVDLTVPNDIDFAACDSDQFRSWGPESNLRAHEGPGQRDLVWAVDLVGNGVHSYASESLIVDAASFPGTPASIVSEIEAILRSVAAGHWG